MDFKLPDRQAVLDIHEIIIEDFGGLKGVPHPEYVESAIARPQRYMSYDDACDLHLVAALLLEAIARNHAFADGNKRTALATMILTYRLNNVKIPYSHIMNKTFEELVLWVTKDKPLTKDVRSKLQRLVENFLNDK